MTLFDYIVIAVLVLSVILGTFRGMVKEVLSLANWVIAFWVANRYGSEMAVCSCFSCHISVAPSHHCHTPRAQHGSV